MTPHEAMTDPAEEPGARADAQALKWFVRNSAAQDAPDAAFEDWLEADPAHRQAYARIEALWRSDAFGAAAARVRTGRGGRGAAKGAAAIAVILLATAGAMRLEGLPLRWPADRSARVGAMESFALEDGTRLSLDSGAAIDLAYTADRREIVLRDGRLMADVGRDPRPFSIRAGGAVIRDVGTRFAVDRQGDKVAVAVADGVVELSRGESPPTRLAAGQKGEWGAAGPALLSAVDEPVDFGWTRHRLYFSDQPLGKVVDELRRYHRGWIVVADEAIAARRISGGLDTRDPASAMEELARLSGGRLSRLSDRLLILR